VRENSIQCSSIHESGDDESVFLVFAVSLRALHTGASSPRGVECVGGECGVDSRAAASSREEALGRVYEVGCACW
jgi:hypothetical protein